MREQQAPEADEQRSDQHHEAHPRASLWAYVQERFPPLLVGMLAVSFGAGCVGLFGGRGMSRAFDWRMLGGFALLYVALLLRYRVVDEWKDFRHDARHYPDRPVPRGAISVRTLAILGIVAVTTEFVLAIVLGGSRGLILYAVVTVLTVGTATDFFAKAFFERHFTISFLLHQVIYVPMFAWAALAMGASLGAASTWWGIASLFCLFVSAELVRKFKPRTSVEGGEVADTYGAVWGRRLALVGTLTLVLAAGWCAHVAAGSWVALGVSVLAAIVIATRSQSDAWVMAGAGAHVPLLALAMVW